MEQAPQEYPDQPPKHLSPKINLTVDLREKCKVAPLKEKKLEKFKELANRKVSCLKDLLNCQKMLFFRIWIVYQRELPKNIRETQRKMRRLSNNLQRTSLLRIKLLVL